MGNGEVDNTVHTWYLKGGATEPESEGKLKSGNGVLVKYGIISIGYWLDGKDRNKFNKVHNFEEYKKYYLEICNKQNEEENIKKRKTWESSPQAQLYDCLKKGDIVWTRVFESKYDDIKDGYYVARVPDDPKNKLFYCNGFEPGLKDLKKADCLVGLKGIDWHGPFSEDAVPGSVSRYIRGMTLVCADRSEDNNPVYDLNKNRWTYTSTVSYLMYNEDKKDPSQIKFKKLSLEKLEDKLNFFKLIGWRGLEDVTALWLQQQNGYYLQPSTCKSGTPGTEYVLIDPSDGKRVFVQTKNSEKNEIQSETYRLMLNDNNDEFYLVSTGKINSQSGNIHVLKKNKNDDYTIPIESLVDFVFDSSNDKFLPKHIVDFKKKLFNL